MGKVVEFGRRPARKRRVQAERRRSPWLWLPLATMVVGAGALYLWTSNAFAPAAASIQGRASVVDGDTIELAGQRVRLNGIDAPETSQQCEDAKGFRYQCGAKSAEALDGFLAKSQPVRCEFVDWDRYGRYVGDCFRADGMDVAAWLVENGHALDWPRYSGGAYAAQQASARTAKRALWSGSFQEPWEWRAKGQAEQPAAVPLLGDESGECNIKGNISNKGERIYHVPGQTFYGKTKISRGRGERWFCSEQEAQQAGWRRAR